MRWEVGVACWGVWTGAASSLQPESLALLQSSPSCQGLGSRGLSLSRNPVLEVAFPSHSVATSITWGRSARCLLAPRGAQARGGVGAGGAAAWAMPSALGPQRGNKARTPPGRFRPRRPPGPAAVPSALLPRARPRVSRSPAAPAPRAPPPPPAPGRCCATCLQPGAHRARSAPGRRPPERGPVPCARRRPTPRAAPASTAWVAAGPRDEPGGLGYGTRLRTRGPQERQATRGTPCGCRSAGLWSENRQRSPSA